MIVELTFVSNFSTDIENFSIVSLILYLDRLLFFGLIEKALTKILRWKFLKS